jgi:hypothetical protein
MDLLQFFRDSSLTSDDAVVFAKSFQLCLLHLGEDRCWCVKKQSHSVFKGFNVYSSSRLMYRSQDARPLILAMSSRYSSEELPVLVRRGICKSPHCLNPAHYYYGTKSDVALENNVRSPRAAKRRNDVTAVLAEQMRMDHDAGESILRLSRKYKIPYYTARRICSDNAYSSNNGNFSKKYLQKLWEQTLATCSKICQDYPKAAKSYNLAYHVSNEMECPWHRKGTSEHKGNFGLMGECLDCMEEIKSGRCTVDVRNFDYQWYWQVKRFWEQVDIRSVDECWPWLGATRRGNSESIACFPSPFHSAKTQSAPRVAFWLSRGYTGKYRIFNKKECASFCCNPTHLTIRELKGDTQPTEVTEICLNHGNIFQHYREANLQEQSGTSIELPPA